MRVIGALLVLFLAFMTQPVAAKELSGKEIVEIHKKRHQVKSAADEVVMLIVDESVEE